jgi:hypothetical protein
MWPAVAFVVSLLAFQTQGFMPHAWLEDIFGAGGISHEGMTRDALTQFIQDSWPENSMPAITATTKKALDAIISANVGVDDDQKHSALHFDGENFIGGQYVLSGTPSTGDATVADLDRKTQVNLFNLVQDKLANDDTLGARAALGVSFNLESIIYYVLTSENSVHFTHFKTSMLIPTGLNSATRISVPP